jgi:quercetin dioxygenase-like cupin family protein
VPTFAHLSELATLPIWPGVLARVVEGELVTMAVVELAPGSAVALHQHPNEQLGLILRGSMTLTAGGERRALGPGDTYTLLADVPHEATVGPEGAVVLDVFSPVRADWKRIPVGPPRPTSWP